MERLTSKILGGVSLRVGYETSLYYDYSTAKVFLGPPDPSLDLYTSKDLLPRGPSRTFEARGRGYELGFVEE